MSRLAVEAEFRVRVGSGSGSFTLETRFDLEDGILVLFGPSGAGKSLTLQAVAGLVRPEAGRILVDGETLFDAERGVDRPAHRRRIGYVPQHHSLFPFGDVTQNVAFGLPRSRRHAEDPTVRKLLDELGLAELTQARPETLSGGERQRVALARALAVEPRLLLLDEPFASIDQEGRDALRRTLRELINAHSISAILVTHDPEEAYQLGTRIVRFERGRGIAHGIPDEVLPGQQSLNLQARIQRRTATGPKGRVRLQLQDVEIEGPESLLTPSDNTSLELSLRPARPIKNPTPPE
jgi:molybdate transport system ATP-binding protein